MRSPAVPLAAGAALTALWMGTLFLAFGVPSNPDPPGVSTWLRELTLVYPVLAIPWLIAAVLLWRAWIAKAGAKLAEMDGAQILLAVATGLLPNHRREWGAAMAAELSEIEGRAARWDFATGCVSVAILPPRSDRTPTFVAATLAILVAALAGLGVGNVLPAMQAFAITFAALLGGFVTLAVARSRRLRLHVPAPFVMAAGAIGVVASVAVVVQLLVEHPESADHLSTTTARVLAVVLAGLLWLTLTPPRVLTSSRVARRLGVATALVISAGVIASARADDLGGTLDGDGGVMLFVLVVPLIVLFVVSAVLAAATSSFRNGVQTTLWAAALGTVGVFAVGVFEAMRWFEARSTLIFDDDGPAPIGQNLTDFTGGLIAFPVWWLPFGVIGAALGVRFRRRLGRRVTRQIDDSGSSRLSVVV